jgi:DNA-binding response OmpR family regulator
VVAATDDLELLSVLRRSLRGSGAPEVEFKTCFDLSNTLHVLRTRPVRLVILSRLASHPDSQVALRELVSQDLKARVLMAGGLATPRARADALAAGACDYLSTPFEPRELHFRVNRALHGFEAVVAPPADGVEGSLGALEVADLVRLVKTGCRSGVLHLRRERVRATMHFLTGEAIACTVEGSTLAPEEAFREVLGWSSGRFELRFSPAAVERTLHAPTEQLLLAALSSLDERSHDQALGRIRRPDRRPSR